MNSERLKTIAQDLPQNVGRKSDARSRLLCVQELLRVATDENHGLNASEIASILQIRSNSKTPPSEPTVLSDIHAIAKNQPLDMQIATASRGGNEGFRCVGSILTKQQVRLLLNIVRASKFVTVAQCSELSNALCSLLSFYDEDKVTTNVFVDRRIRKGEADVMQAAQVVIDAIERGVKIQFKYQHWGLNNKFVYAKSNNGTTFTETPVNLIFSFGNYYAETYDSTREKWAYAIRRLDRIRDIKLLNEPGEQNEEIQNLKKTVKSRVQRNFDMLGGREAELFLEVEQTSADLIYNRFGKEYAFENVVKSNDDEFEKGYLRVTVSLSPTFFRWIFGFQGKVKIVPPRSGIWNRTGSWANLPTANRPVNELQADYKLAIKKYKEMLQNELENLE